MAATSLPAATHTALDPRTLGRPVHLLPGFAQVFARELSHWLHQGLNRRHGTRLEVVGAAFATGLPAAASGLRWRSFGGAAGQIGVALERSLVLHVLHCRYGVPAQGEQAEAPATVGEERLAHRLGQQLAATLARRIDEADAGAAPDCVDENAQPAAAWTLQVRLRAADGVQGRIFFALDEAWVARLLARLAAARPTASRPAPAADALAPLPARLKLRLVARLAERRMALGEVLDLRVGDVVPVSLGDADVLVKDRRLFTATVAEHKGRLWLTAFQDA